MLNRCIPNPIRNHVMSCTMLTKILNNLNVTSSFRNQLGSRTCACDTISLTLRLLCFACLQCATRPFRSISPTPACTARRSVAMPLQFRRTLSKRVVALASSISLSRRRPWRRSVRHSKSGVTMTHSQNLCRAALMSSTFFSWRSP